MDGKLKVTQIHVHTCQSGEKKQVNRSMASHSQTKMLSFDSKRERDIESYTIRG